MHQPRRERRRAEKETGKEERGEEAHMGKKQNLEILESLT